MIQAMGHCRHTNWNNNINKMGDDDNKNNKNRNSNIKFNKMGEVMTHIYLKAPPLLHPTPPLVTDS